MALSVAAPAEQFWHRVPGGTGRATGRTLAALRSETDLRLKLVAAWHRPSRRHPPAGVGPVTYLPWPRPVLYERWLRGWSRPLESALGPFDVAWAATMIPLPTAAPLVATVHDLDFLDHPDRMSRRGASFFPRAWAEVADRAELIVCPSAVVAGQCRRHGIEDDRLEVVPWGVDEPRSTAGDGERVRRRFGLPERFALWVGTLEPRKNVVRLVEAAVAVDDLDLDLAVVGPPGWNLDGRDVLAPLGPRAHGLGLVDDDDLQALYRAASVFVFPSLAEGFGLPVLEAMANGTPVVTSAGTATEEVAGGAAILVDPTDSASIATGIRAALADGGTTMALVERGRARAAELSWSASAQGYRRVFRRAVGEG